MIRRGPGVGGPGLGGHARGNAIPVGGLRARVDAKGRITLPKALRSRLGLTPGTLVLLSAEGEELRGIAPRALMGRQRGARLALRARLRETEGQ